MHRILEGRDPNYQKLAVKGLIGNSKRVLQATKNEDKIRSIKEGAKILEEFLDDFDRENRSKSNKAYLSIDLINAFDLPSNQLASEFVGIYNREAKGRYEHLRTLYPKNDKSKSWDIIRNEQVNKINGKVQANKSKLFKEDGSPTTEHLEMIYWAYSPNADKLKEYIEKVNGKPESNKRKSSSNKNDGEPATKRHSSK